jgi:leucyl aminopeptidase
MQISFVAETKPGALVAGSGTLVLGALEGPKLLPPASETDSKWSGLLARAMAAAGFKGKSGQIMEILVPSDAKLSRILVAGLGKPEAVNAATANTIGASIAAKLLAHETQVTFAIALPKKTKIADADFAAHIAFGAQMRSYRFDAYRTAPRDEKPTLAKVVVTTPSVAPARKAWDQLSAVGEGIFWARDLVNEPPNVLYPEEFARRTKDLSKLGVKVEILDAAQMKKLGMNTLLCVGWGSARPSALVVMQWNGAPKTKKNQPVAFVGKGVCFDSGGLSLKPAASMVGMKGDMAGAATVVGLMRALALRKARVNAVGVIGLVENMPDGASVRPNDVVTSMSGKTVEVLNTDAEGRLVLADALWYTQSRFKPRFMINLATLTGAIVTALGLEHAGLFSNDDKLSAQLAQAGQEEGELVWRMPLSDAYDKLLRSKIADMKNIGGPQAGSITAAQFLQRFVNNVPWAHLDIAGVAWQDSEQKPMIPSWGTGWGVRLLNRLVADHYEA